MDLWDSDVVVLNLPIERELWDNLRQIGKERGVSVTTLLMLTLDEIGKDKPKALITVTGAGHTFRITAEHWDNIHAYLAGNSKIQAIKELRAATGCSLGVAKDVIVALAQTQAPI